jgi:hypothetical protein
MLAAFSFSAVAESRQWTILVYWAVDNDLYEFSKPYLHQFEKLANSPDVSIIVEYDYPDHRPTKRFQLQHSDYFDPLQELSSSFLLEELGETDSAQPQVLKNFIEMGMKKFPAKHTLLIVGSHGSNWSGLIEDKTSRHYMPLSNFGTAINNQNLDMIIFDTCRMAFFETLMTLENKIKYFLASPFDLNGFDHVHPLSALIENPHMTFKELGASYIRYYPLKPENADQKEMAASLLDPELATEMVSDFENFTSLLHQKDLRDLKEKLVISINEERDWDVDLFDLVKKAGDVFPEMMMSSQLFNMKYKAVVVDYSQTPMTVTHSGMSVACAEKHLRYGGTFAGKRLPQWRNLCRRLRNL